VLIDVDAGDGQVVSEYPPQVDRSESLQLAELPLARRFISASRSASRYRFQGKRGRMGATVLARFSLSVAMPLIAQIARSACWRSVRPTRPVASTRRSGAGAQLSSQLAAAIATFRVHDEAQRRNQG
jgi:hypothetical protein